MPRRIPNSAGTFRRQAPQAPTVLGDKPVTGAPLIEQVGRIVEHWAASAQHTKQTRLRMSETVTRFAARATATGVPTLESVTLDDVRGFVSAPTRQGAPPEVATQHARRTALRTMFRTARTLGLVAGDPTLDLTLTPRGSLAARPLSDDEVTLCRASAQMLHGNVVTVRATAWALGEAGAVSSEITGVRILDLDLAAARVCLPGTRRHDPRVAPLTPWARLILGRRVEELRSIGAPESALVAYGGSAPSGGAKAQAAVCNALREVLDAAGLLTEPDLRPASLRNWVGRSAYEAGCSVEEVAMLLGHRSLDATAEDIALTWRPYTPGAPDDLAVDAARSRRTPPAGGLRRHVTSIPEQVLHSSTRIPENAHLSAALESEETQ
jgi:site-specific recombinase XerD